MLKKITTFEKKGIWSGLFSPILYSIDSVLDILLFALVFGVAYQEDLSIWQTLCYSFVTSFFKDMMLFICMHLKAKTNVLATFKKIKKTKRRAFWWTVLGSVSGGTIGFTLTTATILYSGASYGSALSNLSPIIVLLFVKKFLKTKLNLPSWVGVALALTGFLGISFYSLFLQNVAFVFNMRIFIGIVFAIFSILTWSVETVVAEYVEKFGPDQSLNDDEKLIVKSVSSTGANAFGFLPLVLFLAFISKQHDPVIAMLGQIFSSWIGWTLLVIMAIIIVLGRFSYWHAISHIGGGRADILYYLTVLMTPLLVLFLYGLQIAGFYQPLGATSWVYWLFLSSKMTGVFLITINAQNSKEHLFSKSTNK